MSSERLVLSDKYKAFLQCDASAEFLEGTTAAGKTTVGLFKFILKVADREKSCIFWQRMILARLRRISFRKISESLTISVRWWSTKAMDPASTKCRISAPCIRRR